MRFPNKIFFVVLAALLTLGYLGCFACGNGIRRDLGHFYVCLCGVAVAPSIAATGFSRIRRPFGGGLLTVPFSAALFYYLCVLPDLNVKIEPPSAGVLFFGLCVLTACALLPAALVHCACCRVDQAMEKRRVTRLRIGAMKAMQVMAVGVLCGIPVVFLLAPTPPRPAPWLPWKIAISLALLATIPLAGLLGVAAVLVCPPEMTAVVERGVN
jgi:hypothetical protein